MNTRGIEVHPIDIELDLDDSSLPAEHLGLIAESGEARIQSLTVEREAAYRQMQRLMQDISSLRARELSFEVTRQSEMADMMFRIGLVAELRKGGGVEHVVRAGVMSALLANQMGWSPELCDAIQLAAPLRDIGWAAQPEGYHAVDEAIPEQRATQHAHCLSGAVILGDSRDNAMSMAASIAAAHHERHNGSGYPGRLSGVAIPVAARIAGCVDAFDALTRGDEQRSGLAPQDALAQILRADAWFDPEVLVALAQIQELLLAIRHALDSAVVTNDIRAALRSQWRPGFWRCFLA